jgi:hypothetical protein
MSQINKYAMCKHNNIVTDAPSIRLTFLSQKYILMIYRLLEFGSINCVCHVRKLKYKLSSFPSMYTNVFVLLDISELK